MTALRFALMVGLVATMVWVGLDWAAPKLNAPRADPAARLCDRAVWALLHSDELIEVERAAAIVREIPCGIERRL